MEISKEFIDQFLQIVNKQSNSKCRSKQDYGKFTINEVLMDYRNHETDFTLDYIELDRVDRFKELGNHMCFKKKYIGNTSDFRSQFYEEVVKWFIFSKTVETSLQDSEGNKIVWKSGSDLINYGIGK